MVSSDKTVLVVDDDPDIREVMVDALEAEGYRVFTAGDGGEALAWLRAGAARPDLILLDLMMPRVDGTQFRSEQRKDPRLDVIPVVVLSADASLPDRARALGVAGYLRKPVGLDALLDTVRGYCP